MLTKLAQTVTLREFLTREKPSLVTSGRMRPSNSTKGVEKWPDLEESHKVKPWSDFNLDVMNQSFGHILDTAVSPAGALRAREPHEVYPENTVITEIDDVLHLILWNKEVLEPALDFARTLEPLRHLSKLPIHHQCSRPPPNKSAVRVASGSRKQAVGHLISLRDASPVHLLVGIARPAVKFSFRGALQEGSCGICTGSRLQNSYTHAGSPIPDTGTSRPNRSSWFVAFRTVPKPGMESTTPKT